MAFTLSSIEEKPSTVTCNICLDNNMQVLFRPLERSDIQVLAIFLGGLSHKTREMSVFSGYDRAAAKELCDAINKYDKFRMVLEVNYPKNGQRIVGLIEFSFDIPEKDIQRFREAGIRLDSDVDCRLGPTLADDFQNLGLGSKVFPRIKEIALQFGKKRIILWGGVLKSNTQAIKFYEKHGFKRAGSFVNQDCNEVIDMIVDLT